MPARTAAAPGAFPERLVFLRFFPKGEIERVPFFLVLLDARHGPTKLDREAIKFLSFEAVTVTFVITKSDTLKTQSERARRRKEVREALREMRYDPDGAIWVSARTGDGLKELARCLKES